MAGSLGNSSSRNLHSSKDSPNLSKNLSLVKCFDGFFNNARYIKGNVET